MKLKFLQKLRAALLVAGLCSVGNMAHGQTYTFTNAGATGTNGPTQTNVTNAYSSTNLAGNVTSTAGIQTWSVPVGGLYKIEVYGANGYGPFAGRGAYMSGEFNFNASDVLKILVGQQGGCCVASGTQQFGGGGGTFVVDATNTPLIVAGGGGGVNGATSIPVHSDANITTNGNAGVGTTAGSTGGTNGGGGGGIASAGGGGGFTGNGGVTAGNPGGFSFLNGGAGGTAVATSGGWGGFGGGGGANSWDNRRGGGGGGYSGGGGAGSATTGIQAGGGGGSYNTGANQVNTPGLGTGHGSVVITLLVPAVSVPNNTGATGFPSLLTSVCPGNQTVSVKVRNYGNNLVSSVKIGWAVNGVLQNDIVYPVALNPYPGPVYETTITVGTYNFGPGTYAVKAWTSLPNNQTDPVSTNDTAIFTVPVQLTGTYTVNSSLATGGTNFQSFTDFASALNNYGICGPVVANVAAGSGPYNEQITISQVAGSSATNTITINGNGCTLTQNLTTTGANYATFRLDGTDYVTVNNLNFEALGALYGFGVHLGNSADNNSFNNCNITINPTATATTTAGVVMSGSPIIYSTAGQNGSNNTFTGCNVTGGYFGFTFYGTSTAGNSNNSIINCTAKEYYLYGSYHLQQANATISGNIFERPTRAATSTFYGVTLTTGCVNMLVEKNIIRNAFTMQPTGTTVAYCLYCAVDGTLGNENKFINNLVYNINNNGITYGMYFSGADYIKAYHNTISLDNTASTAGDTYGLYSTGTVGGMDFKDNNITITRNGSGLKYCLYYSGGLQSSNNNNLYINATGGTNAVGFYGVAFTTLANWQTANGGIYDALSQNQDPLYFNPAGGDFTPTNPGIDNLGVYVNVNTDILGNPRSPSTPDMGAYETASAPCSSPPAAGSATANPPSGICGGASIAVNLTGTTFGSGQTYQWESAASIGGPYTPVSGSLVSPATTLTATNTIYYRAAVTCNSITSYSTPVLVTVGASGGTAATSTATICIGSNAGLSLTGYTGNNIQWEYYDNNTASWSPVAGGTTANYSVSNVQATTNYRAAVSCNSPAGTVYSNTITVTVTNPAITNVFPGSRCDPGAVTLAAKGSPGTTVNWYAAATGGTSLGTGGAFTTPSIAATTTYYAAASTGSTQTVGPNDMSIGTYAAWSATAQWLNFTVLSPTTIQSVDMFFSAAIGSPFSVVIRDATTLTNVFTYNGNVSVVSTSTAQVVPLNATLQPGSYQMNIGAVIGTYRNDAGGVYPYTIPGVLSITGNTFNVVYYYMFYRWVVGTNCEGSRVPVSASINGSASGTGLATGGTTTGTNHLDGTTVNYNDGCNDKVATVVDAPGGNTLGITSAIALTSAAVQTFNGAPYVSRVFDITPASSGPATVTLYALQSEFTAYNSYVTSNSLGLPLLPTGPLDVTGISHIRITQFHGSAFSGTTGPLGLYDAANTSFITNNNIIASWTGQYWTITFPVTGFSGFFIHSGNSPLIINLRDISATNIGNRNRVDWSTVFEKAGDAFELQRSGDGKDFAKLADINAKGQASNYTYWDNSPLSGTSHYRLKIKDDAGRFSYSKVVTASLKGKGSFTVEAYPNPMNERFTVSVQGDMGSNAIVIVTDISGKVLQQESMTANTKEINMNGYASGMYLVKYQDDNRTQTIKVTKK